MIVLKRQSKFISSLFLFQDKETQKHKVFIALAGYQLEKKVMDIEQFADLVSVPVSKIPLSKEGFSDFAKAYLRAEIEEITSIKFTGTK